MTPERLWLQTAPVYRQARSGHVYSGLPCTYSSGLVMFLRNDILKQCLGDSQDRSTHVTGIGLGLAWGPDSSWLNEMTINSELPATINGSIA